MADILIKGFSIGSVTRKIDYDTLENRPSIPTTVAELTDAGNYATKAEVSAQTSADITALNLSTTYAAKSYETTVDTLVGSDTGKSIRSISAEEVAKIVASADTNYDTLKEIADWIQNDTTGAAKMANDISNLNASAHTHTNKTVLDGITAQNVSDWSAKQAALSDTDNGYGQRVKAIEDTLAAAINFEAQSY